MLNLRPSLMSTAVHGAQVVGGIQKNHTTRVKRPLGLWSRPQRGQGEGKGKGKGKGKG
jgi:hypothetical protein